MKKLIVKVLFAIIATQKLLALDLNYHEKIAAMGIVETNHNGDFASLQGRQAEINLIDKQRCGNFTNLILSYEKNGNTIRKVLEIDEDNIFTSGDCGCLSICATTPDRQGEEITVDLVVHDCYFHMSKPWKAVVTQSFRGHPSKTSTMRMTGKEKKAQP